MRANIHFPECGILGMALLTDYPPAADYLADRQSNMKDRSWSPRDTEFNAAFPGLIDAVVSGMKELGSRRLKANAVTYFNFRIQVWALGFDADPSPVYRIIPTGILTEEDDSAGESVH